jgi:phage repressor protein C with HTH and peptisase S24 domain
MTDSQEEKTEMLRGFAWRLNSASSAQGLTQVDIAERLGVKRPRVGNWFQGLNYPHKAERVALAKLLDVTLEWLMEGKTENDRFRPKEVEASRAEVGGPPVRQIPVISWSHAGEAVAYDEMPRHFHGKVSTTSTDPKAFALTVEGDSMEPKVFTGDRVVCEPSRSPINGKPVVAKHANEEVQLRIYHKLPSGKIRLSSTKPEIYPTIEYDPSGFHWIYPVKELVRSF